MVGTSSLQQRKALAGSNACWRSTRIGVLSVLIASLLGILLWLPSTSIDLQTNVDSYQHREAEEITAEPDQKFTRKRLDKRMPTGNAPQHLPNGFDVENRFKDANLLTPTIPTMILREVDNVRLEESRVAALDFDVFFTEAKPPVGVTPRGEVLLLHGQAFSSQNWLDIKTPQILAAAGYKTIAVDLPGYGHTSGKSVPGDQKSDFIRSLIDHLKLKKPTLISPSMSGTFAIPFLLAHPDSLTSYVPIAPVGTGDFSHQQYEELKTPTLILYGERDTSLGMMSLSNLKFIPNSVVVKLANAGHAAYLNQPEHFHTALLNFLNLVKPLYQIN